MTSRVALITGCGKRDGMGRAFFGGLGREASAAIADLWGQMMAQAGNLAGEDFSDRAGRLNAMKKQAEEIVLADLALLPPEAA